MSTDTAAFAPELSPVDRVEVLFEELSELTGQRNAVDARILDIIAEIDRGAMAGITGERADWWWYTPFEPKAPPTLN